jgi:hypothetical protein
VLSFQAHISKRVPPDMAVSSDLRVCATGLLAECVVVSSNGHSKTLKSEVTFSEHNRYGSEKRAPGRIISPFSKISMVTDILVAIGKLNDGFNGDGLEGPRANISSK